MPAKDGRAGNMLGRFFRKEPPRSDAPASAHPREDSTQRLDAALREYQRQFYARLQHQDSDEEQQAREIVHRAQNLVRTSGLGAALAPTLLEEVRHWPSWSTRADFREYVHFPATDVVASEEKQQDGYRNIDVATIYFMYADRRYGVVFTDPGASHLPEPSHFCKVELVADVETVLGLDINQEYTTDYSVWRWFNVFAFKPGDWMKHLIEIAAHIETGRGEFEANDYKERAKNIKL